MVQLEVQVALAEAARVVVVTLVVQVLPTQAVEAVAAVLVQVVAMLVQALSFFATPAPFNISLVAQ
jgi:hypothetical protein